MICILVDHQLIHPLTKTIIQRNCTKYINSAYKLKYYHIISYTLKAFSYKRIISNISDNSIRKKGLGGLFSQLWSITDSSLNVFLHAYVQINEKLGGKSLPFFGILGFRVSPINNQLMPDALRLFFLTTRKKSCILSLS